MGRREMMAKAIRQKLKKNRAPVIIVLPCYACTDGEPLVTWLLDYRQPTEAEIAVAIERAWQQPSVRRIEPLGNTKYTLEARAAVQAAKERAKPQATTWRRCTSCKTRIEVPADGSITRCPSCGKGT